jgi:signal transduction histidine kinase
LHNGKIMIESELNKGTTFIMEFKKIVLWKKF